MKNDNVLFKLKMFESSLSTSTDKEDRLNLLISLLEGDCTESELRANLVKNETFAIHQIEEVSGEPVVSEHLTFNPYLIEME
jgi:hypothetical protein